MSRKSERLSDYKKVETLDAKGKKKIEIIYTGEYYTPGLSDEVMNKYRLLCWIISSFILIVYIASGLLNNSGSRIFYVILPYVFAFLPMGYMFSGCWYMTVSERKMTKASYDKSVRRLKKCTSAIMCLSLFTFVSDAVYTLISFRDIHVGKEILYMILHECCFGVCIWFGKFQKKISFICEIPTKPHR